ncbi:MAG TPA: hypothetical protein VMA54_18315 [Steroidobacteraceae bacterium]|nr:hypothetical protein [Steroidobacteraceae bacterium]
MQNAIVRSDTGENSWLKRYYLGRFVFSAAWVALAFTVGKNAPGVAAIMLILYPIWDALANLIDGQRTGGLAHNKSQLFNFIVSVLTAIAVVVGLRSGMGAVVVVFGVWAGLAGALQLATAVRRWKSFGAQWSMILSGAQSALAGVFFVKMASGSHVSAIATVAPYAAFGAFYFLVSGLWLAVGDARRRSKAVAP